MLVLCEWLSKGSISSAFEKVVIWSTERVRYDLFLVQVFLQMAGDVLALRWKEYVLRDAFCRGCVRA